MTIENQHFVGAQMLPLRAEDFDVVLITNPQPEAKAVGLKEQSPSGLKSSAPVGGFDLSGRGFIPAHIGSFR